MMIYSVLFRNYLGVLTYVDCDVHQGFPSFDVIINSSLSHSRSISERLRVAIRNQDFKFPNSSVSIQITPNIDFQNFDILDLPIALAVVLNKCNTDKKILAFGSVDFQGSVRKTSCNIQAIINFAKRNGFMHIIMPEVGNKRDGSKDDYDLDITFVSNLQDAVKQCIKIINSSDIKEERGKAEEKIKITNPFEGVVGLDNAKASLIIAAAGGHNVLLVGPRGGGKSLLLSKFNKIFFEFNTHLKEERIQNRALIEGQGEFIDDIQSNVLDVDNYNMSKCFNLSSNNYPVVLQQHGCYLRIDEIADIEYKYLQLLKDVIDKGYIIKANEKYPLHISIIASTNPCPCGNRGLMRSVCTCPKTSIEKHWKSLKTSILTRFELIVPVLPADFSKEVCSDYSNSLQKIKNAHLMQEERYKNTKYSMNSDIVRLGLWDNELQNACKFFPDCDNVRDVLVLYSLSRTIADLDGAEDIKNEHREKAKLLWVNDIENLY